MNGASRRTLAPNPAIFAAYAAWYPGWHIALCCYDGSIEAEPMVFWYEPLDPTRLFAPALDAHDGRPPVLNGRVERNHYTFFASSTAARGMRLNRDPLSVRIPSQYRWLFLDYFTGTHLNIGTRTPNGDFSLAVAELSKERPEMETILPPGA